MVTITKKEARKRRIPLEGKICKFHEIQPDQKAIMDTCENCFVVEDPCGCNFESECEVCHPEKFIKDKTYKDATHDLSCEHSINSISKINYTMPCLILKELPNDRVKILVFGYKTNPDYSKKRIRYVDKTRLTKKGDKHE